MRIEKIYLSILISLCSFGHMIAQAVPSPEENIPFLVTFGNQAATAYGDDDNTQIFFFSIPKSFNKPFYIRIFDPETGGQNDEIVKTADTECTYSLYGGLGCISDKAARSVNPTGNYKSGNLLHTKTFGSESDYDNQWYTIGPLNPSQGEYVEEYFGYIFKLICQGIKGNDGNLYRYFLSSSPSQNIPVEGGNAFTFEYSFRLYDKPGQTAHIYPYVDNKVVSIKQTNFDFDSDGDIKLYSIATIGTTLSISGDDEWKESTYVIKPKEKGTSLDIQIVQGAKPKRNNNVVFYVTNQYGEALPFFAVPIGGVPKYKGKITFTPSK
jgi:hypothetical protein